MPKARNYGYQAFAREAGKQVAGSAGFFRAYCSLRLKMSTEYRKSAKVTQAVSCGDFAPKITD